MKKFKLLSVLFMAAIALTTTSCDDDDDVTPPVILNEFTYNDVSYPLTQGILEAYGANGNGSYDFDITLFSDGITYDTTAEDFIGVGHLFYLDLNSDVMTGLSDGTYTFAMDRDAFTLVDGEMTISFDSQNQSATSIVITAGTIVLTKSGDIYSLKLNLESITGDAITGNYVGLLSSI